MTNGNRKGLEWALSLAFQAAYGMSDVEALVKDKFTVALWLIDLVLRREEEPLWTGSKEDEFDRKRYNEYKNEQIENNPTRKLSEYEYEC